MLKKTIKINQQNYSFMIDIRTGMAYFFGNQGMNALVFSMYFLY